MAPPELRRDPTVGRWVIVSADRGKRPTDFSPAPPAKAREDHEPCPFCPGFEDRTPPESCAVGPEGRLPDAPGWRRRVVSGTLPVVAADEELVKQGEGMFDMMTGFGVHEIIVDTPFHEECPATMSDGDFIELVTLWRDRFLVHRADPRLRCITLCSNRGVAAGALSSHSHSQIIATPALPRRLAEEISTGYAYFQGRERCVFCDIVEAESCGERIVWESEDFLVATPYAARFPCETWVLPKRHESHFEESDAADLEAFARALKRALAALHVALSDPPLSFVMHTAPPAEKGMVHFHWHVEIMPRLTNIAGFEWGTGFYINALAPETAATVLREALKDAD